MQVPSALEGNPVKRPWPRGRGFSRYLLYVKAGEAERGMWQAEVSEVPALMAKSPNVASVADPLQVGGHLRYRCLFCSRIWYLWNQLTFSSFDQNVWQTMKLSTRDRQVASVSQEMICSRRALCNLGDPATVDHLVHEVTA